MDAEIEAEAIAEFGSLSAAAETVRIKAKRTGDPLDSFLANDLGCRADALNETASGGKSSLQVCLGS